LSFWEEHPILLAVALDFEEELPTAAQSSALENVTSSPTVKSSRSAMNGKCSCFIQFICPHLRAQNPRSRSSLPTRLPQSRSCWYPCKIRSPTPSSFMLTALQVQLSSNVILIFVAISMAMFSSQEAPLCSQVSPIVCRKNLHHSRTLSGWVVPFSPQYN
jgi:hypothetical protein